MAELLLVNPRKRRKAKKTAKRRTTGRSLVAASKRAVKSVRRRFRRNPIGGSGASAAINQFKVGAIGAAGALAVDVAMQKLPIPLNLKTGALAPIVKGLVGVGLGMLVAKFGKNKQLGHNLAQGAVTVSLYGAGREMLKAPLGLSDADELSGDFDMGAYEMGELLAAEDHEMGELLGAEDELGVYDFGAYENGGAIVN